MIRFGKSCFFVAVVFALPLTAVAKANSSVFDAAMAANKNCMRLEYLSLRCEVTRE